MNELIFSWGSKALLLISLNKKIEQLTFMQNAEIYWRENDTKMLIGKGFSSDFGEALEEKFKAVINGSLLFSSSLCTSPGVLFNMFYCTFNTNSYFIENDGVDYVLFSSYSSKFKRAAYLYNDTDNKIIFEIGEMFAWLDEDFSTENDLLKEKENFLSFIADYKPIAKEVIPLEIAEKWLAQAKNLNETIKQNVMKEFSVYEK